jgi:DNA-binding transcriptional LysR family regulator
VGSLDPAQMLVFAALARTGGVRTAATALGIPRSTVSRRLDQLERAVGAPLIVRTARRFELTPLGQTLADRCAALEALLRESEALLQRATDEPSGVLRVNAAPVLAEEILADVVAELARRYPRLAVEVRTSVEYVDLRRGGVDIVLRARRLADASDLYATHLGTSVTGCYASPAYVAAHGLPERLEDLAKHDCIVVGGAATWTFAGERDVGVTGRIRVDNFRIARSLAALGVGIVRTAAVFAAPLVAANQLVPVLEPHWWHAPIYAGHAGPNPPSPNVRAFLTLARAAVARALPPNATWRSA